MTPFQKLFWLFQMGISTFSDEKPQNYLKKTATKSLGTLADLDALLLNEKNTLSKTAMHTLCGTGVTKARIMCVLESPSATEDRTGIYLSGEEGELTQKILSSIGLDLQKNTYLTYLSPWRPPGNRLLTATEIDLCQKYLDKRIQILQPDFILILGVPVIRALLNGHTLSQVRQGREKYMQIPTFGTFAPAWLMKNPTYRRQVWEDLKKFKTMISG